MQELTEARGGLKYSGVVWFGYWNLPLEEQEESLQYKAISPAPILHPACGLATQFLHVTHNKLKQYCGLETP